MAGQRVVLKMKDGKFDEFLADVEKHKAAYDKLPAGLADEVWDLCECVITREQWQAFSKEDQIEMFGRLGTRLAAAMRMPHCPPSVLEFVDHWMKLKPSDGVAYAGLAAFNLLNIIIAHRFY